MSTFLKLLLSFSILFFITSCKSNSTEPNIEKAITDLVVKFPQLPKSESKITDFYKLKRSFTNGDKGYSIQLYSSPDSLKDPQKILIFLNSKGKYYALPLFSNT